MSNKPTRGGARPGSGRKPRTEPLAALSLRIERDLLEAWQARKQALGLTGPATLAHLLGWRKEKAGQDRP